MDFLTANDRVGEYPDSYYAATATPLDAFPAARGDLSCDICVIGGGFMGLSTALHLAEQGYQVTLVEAQRVGFGASGRNGGQVSGGQRLHQDDLEELVGKDLARKLWALSQESVDVLRGLDQKYDTGAGWAAGVIEADHRARFVPHTHAYVDKLNTEYGYDKIRKLDRDELYDLCRSDAYHGGAIDMGGGHFHPLRFALGLARACRDLGVTIYEQTRVTRVEEGEPAIVHTEGATIRARYVVMGCNGYLGRMQERVAARVMPINNFIIATEPLADPELVMKGNHCVADSKYVINYFRLSDDNRMLFGGGESYGYKFPSDIEGVVRKAMAQIFPQLNGIRVDYAWGGTLGITMNRLPHVERITGNILSLSGFSGHGVALATFAGKVAAEAIAGQAEKFDIMASVPSPRFPGGAALRHPLLVLGMLWFGLKDRF
ncbi:MAG: FAD-binding oxidoreductase [Marivivens sp.]|jgi:gamma-glutamylputrescine oxidase|nr:FAD-binding oxidoreductase [Marivivens geojensis]NBX10374.1 FAD-binding oxidoreductase [Marivivens sp.]